MHSSYDGKQVTVSSLVHPWLRSVKAISPYENDEYWIQDRAGLHHQLQVSDTVAPALFSAEDADVDTLG